MNSETAGAAAEPSAGKPPTIYDVARVAGVSHQTVSRLLKGDKGIKPRNRERVLQALEQLNYRPNLSARSLATSRSHRVAVLTQEISQVGPGKIAQGAGEEARKHGFVLDIITLDVGDRAGIEDAIKIVNHQDAAGILALASTDELIDMFEHADFGVPTILGAEEDEAAGGRPSELSAYAIEELVEHLVGLGHRRIFHIAGPRAWVAARNREFAIGRALRERNLSLQGTAYGDWSAESGYRAAQHIVNDLDATAIVAANDQMALGAMLALTEAGLAVPRDVSVTGIDDIPEAAYLMPPLTTLRLNFQEQGRDAFRRLMAQMREDVPPAPRVSAELVIRKSTAPAAR